MARKGSNTCIQNFGAGTLRIEDLGEDGGGIILKWIFKKQASAKWWAVVTPVILQPRPTKCSEFFDKLRNY